jgi:hypothetical protein
MMLGTVMFPILLSMGVPPAVCGGLLMMSFPIGASLNPAVVGGTAAIQRVPLTSAWVFFMWWAGIQAIALLMFLSIEFLRMKRTTVRPATILRSIAGILILLAFVAAIAFADSYAKYLPSAAGSIMIYAKKGIYLLLYYGIAVILLLGILICQWNWWRHRRNTGQWNLLTPVLPLIFVVLYGMRQAIIPAFMASLAYGFFTTPREGGVQKLGRAIIDGIADVAAPAILMVGIGMLIAAALHPRVDLLLTPILAKVVPTRPFAYILFFLLASPLSLYRGPLNNFGLGAGVANLMQHFLPAGATMGALQSVGMLQDPTTTQNVWVCGYLKLDINALLYKLFFYGVGLCVAGLILSSLLYF